MWQWWNTYEHVKDDRKKLLRINMDETAVRLYMTPRISLIASQCSRRHRSARTISHSASLQQQRTCVTHAAFVCDDTTIQVLLPHILIGSTHVLSVAVKNAVEPLLHRNVFLLRRKSAWVNVDMMVAIMKLLGHILRPHMARFQPVLVMDALAAHIAGRVLRAAGAAGLWVVVIPAKITWLLQPADTHCFLKYKAYLRQRYQELACDAVDGRVSLTDVLLAMNSGCRKVFQAHAWSKSFDDNGFTRGQRLVRRSILNHVEWEEVPPLPPILPTLRQFAAIWPQRKDIPLDDLFRAFQNPRLPPPTHPHPAPAASQISEDMEPWHLRLRPRPDRVRAAADADSQPEPLALSAPGPSATSSQEGPLPARPDVPWITVPRARRLGPAGQ